MRRVIATVVVGMSTVLMLAGCPSDDCSTPGATKTQGGLQYRCEKKQFESNYHWHEVSDQPPVQWK